MDDPKGPSSELLSLEAEVDGATRNAVALRLAEAKVAGLDQVLVRLIQRPDLANNRGTLVHALRHYDCAPHLALLADLVATGNFEVAHEALEAIETIEHVEGSKVRASYAMIDIARTKDNLEPWRRCLLDELFEKFD